MTRAGRLHQQSEGLTISQGSSAPDMLYIITTAMVCVREVDDGIPLRHQATVADQITSDLAKYPVSVSRPSNFEDIPAM